MKKKGKNNLIIILLVVIIVILAVLCLLFATNTISLNSNKDSNNNDSTSSENVTNNNSVEDSSNSSNNSSITEDKVTENIVTVDEVKNAYKNFITKQGDCVYAIADLMNDNNIIKELIIRTGDYEAEYQFNIYTYDNGSVKKIFTLDGGHTGLYLMNNGNLMRLYAHMGYEEVTVYKYEDGEFKVVSENKRELGENDEYTLGDNEIELVESSDTSALDSYK